MSQFITNKGPARTYIQMYDKMKNKDIYFLFGKRLHLYASILDKYPELVEYVVSCRVRDAKYTKPENFNCEQFLGLEMGLMFTVINSCYGKDGINVIDYLKRSKINEKQ